MRAWVLLFFTTTCLPQWAYALWVGGREGHEADAPAWVLKF